MDNTANTHVSTKIFSEDISNLPRNQRSRIVPVNTQPTSFSVRSNFDDSNHSISLEPLSHALQSAKSMHSGCSSFASASTIPPVSTTTKVKDRLSVPLHPPQLTTPIIPTQIHPQSLYTNFMQIEIMSKELPYCVYKAFQALEHVIKDENRDSMFQFGPCVIYLAAFIARIAFENKSWFGQRIPCDFYAYSNPQIHKAMQSYSETLSSQQLASVQQCSQSGFKNTEKTASKTQQIDDTMIPFAPVYTEVVRWVTNIGNLWRTNAPFNKRDPADSDICEGARGIYTTPGMKVDPAMFTCVKKANNMPEWDEKDKYFDENGKSRMSKALKWSDVTKITTLQWNMDQDSITFFRWCITKVCLYMDTLVSTWEKPKAAAGKKGGSKSGSKSVKSSKLKSDEEIHAVAMNLHKITPNGMILLTNADAEVSSPLLASAPQSESEDHSEAPTTPVKRIHHAMAPSQATSQSQTFLAPDSSQPNSPAPKPARTRGRFPAKAANQIILTKPTPTKQTQAIIAKLMSPQKHNCAHPQSASPPPQPTEPPHQVTQEVLSTPTKQLKSQQTDQSSQTAINLVTPLKSPFPPSSPTQSTPIKSISSPIKLICSPRLQPMAKAVMARSKASKLSQSSHTRQDPTTMSSILTTPLHSSNHHTHLESTDAQTSSTTSTTARTTAIKTPARGCRKKQAGSTKDSSLPKDDDNFLISSKTANTRAILSPPDMKYNRMTRAQAKKYGFGISECSTTTTISNQASESQLSQTSLEQTPSQSTTTPVRKITFELSDFPTAIASPSQPAQPSSHSSSKQAPPQSRFASLSSTNHNPYSRLQPLSQSAVSRLSVTPLPNSNTVQGSEINASCDLSGVVSDQTSQPKQAAQTSTPLPTTPQSLPPIDRLTKPYAHLTFPLVDPSFDYIRSNYAAFTPTFLKFHTLTIPHESMIYCVTHVLLVASEFGSRPFLYGKQCTLREMEYLTSLLSSWLLFISQTYPTSHALNRELVTEIVCCLYIAKHNGILLTPAVLRAMRFTVDLCLVDYYQRWACPISGIRAKSSLSTKIAQSLRLGPPNVKECTYIPIISFNQDKDSDACLFAQYHTHFLIGLLYTLAVSDTFGGSGYNNYPTVEQDVQNPNITDSVYKSLMTAMGCEDDSILPNTQQWAWMYDDIDTKYQKYQAYQEDVSESETNRSTSPLFEMENFWINQRNEHKRKTVSTSIPSVNKYTNLDPSQFDNGYKFIYQQTFQSRNNEIESAPPSDLCGCPMCTYQIYVIPQDRIQECMTLCALVDEKRYSAFQFVMLNPTSPQSLLTSIPSVLHDINVAFVQIPAVKYTNFTPPDNFLELLDPAQNNTISLWQQQIADINSRYKLWTESVTDAGQTRLKLIRGTKDSTTALFDRQNDDSDEEYTQNTTRTNSIRDTQPSSDQSEEKPQKSLIDFYQKNYYVQFYPDLVSKDGFAQAKKN